MSTVQDFCQFLEDFAPPRLAEEWDNVGLLLGDRSRTTLRVMTCLTITPESVQEAISRRTNLVVTHHPLPFRPLKRVTFDTVEGRMLLQLIENQIAVYSPHTSFDSAQEGINQQLAEGLGLVDVRALEPIADDPDRLGAGRVGQLPGTTTLADFVEAVKQFLDVRGLHCVGSLQQNIHRAAVACGSAGQFLEAATEAGCDVLVTGETSFHTCLAAKANQIAMVLPGHFASERFAVESLANVLQNAFGNVEVWPSQNESNPLDWV